VNSRCGLYSPGYQPVDEALFRSAEGGAAPLLAYLMVHSRGPTRTFEEVAGERDWRHLRRRLHTSSCVEPGECSSLNRARMRDLLGVVQLCV